MKAKIVKLHSETLKTTTMADIDKNNQIEKETPSLYHILQVKKRRSQRTIQSIEDSQGINSTPNPKKNFKPFHPTL
jgi:hypothetical protein